MREPTDDGTDALRHAVARLAHDDGLAATGLPGVSTLRGPGPSVRMPATHHPHVYVLLDGSLTLHGQAVVRTLAPGDVLISQIDTPALAHTSDHAPVLALVVEFTLDEVMAVLLDFDSDLPGTLFTDTTRSEATSNQQADARLVESLTRLVELDEGEDAAFMAKHLKREVTYRLITGPQGRTFIGAVTNIRAAAEMYYVNSWIKQNYREAFTVEELARQSDLSPSAFHRKFKDAVQMGPLQCQKQLRLTEARRLLLDGGVSVADAAVQVGYESVSQFIREYRREYGRTPRRDITSLRQRLGTLTHPDASS